jgi:predicted RNA-binding protein with PIN domain
LILKEKIIISISEILKLIEKIEIAIKNKKKRIDKSCDRLRKNVSKEIIVILEEIKNQNKISEDDNNDDNNNININI